MMFGNFFVASSEPLARRGRRVLLTYRIGWTATMRMSR
jgi:hypothetical protein